jgi:hypothetical protein
VGDVIRDPVDDLEIPGGMPSVDVEAAVTGEMATAATVEVPVEEQHTEGAVVTPGGEAYAIERRQQKLVLRYKAWLEERGSEWFVSGFSPRRSQAAVLRCLRQDTEQPRGS